MRLEKVLKNAPLFTATLSNAVSLSVQKKEGGWSWKSRICSFADAAVYSQTPNLAIINCMTRKKERCRRRRRRSRLSLYPWPCVVYVVCNTIGRGGRYFLPKQKREEGWREIVLHLLFFFLTKCRYITLSISCLAPRAATEEAAAASKYKSLLFFSSWWSFLFRNMGFGN